MNKTDIQKGKMVYYARMLKPVGIYEVCDLYVRTVRDDYFVATTKMIQLNDAPPVNTPTQKKNARILSNVLFIFTFSSHMMLSHTCINKLYLCI